MTITVTNNLDGTFTVTCGIESAIIGMPRAAAPRARNPRASLPKGPFIFPPISSSGGGVVAHIIDIGDESPRGISVNDKNEILEHLRAAAAAESGHAGARPHVLEFSFPGQHSIDIGEIRSAIAEAGPGATLGARIFVGKIS